MANVLGVFTTSLSRTTCCDPDEYVSCEPASVGRQMFLWYVRVCSNPVHSPTQFLAFHAQLRLQLAKSDHLPCSRREFVWCACAVPRASVSLQIQSLLRKER
jgi:hypothetical protein